MKLDRNASGKATARSPRHATPAAELPPRQDDRELTPARASALIHHHPARGDRSVRFTRSLSASLVLVGLFSASIAAADHREDILFLGIRQGGAIQEQRGRAALGALERSGLHHATVDKPLDKSERSCGAA